MDMERFSGKLGELRKAHGYSQEQLADLMGVSRQAVSKWESGASVPDIDNLVRLGELYGQTLDSLIKGAAAETPDVTAGDAPPAQDGAAAEQVIVLDGLSSKILRIRLGGGWSYEYKSKTTVFGVPLVHVHLGRKNGRLAVAKGIIAIGTAAVGVVSAGIFSLGLLSLGMLSLGLLASLGILSAGVFAGGVLAAGFLAYGVVALGYVAVGVTSIGVYSGGVAAVAARVAVGVSASAPVAIGTESANGMYTLLIKENTNATAVLRLIELYAPEIPNWVLNRLVNISRIL